MQSKWIKKNTWTENKNLIARLINIFTQQIF